MSIFYDRDGIVVRTSKDSDISSMKDRLRDSDVREIWASHHMKSEEALDICVNDAIFSATIENGRPIGIFGINTNNVLGNKANVFLLATEDLDKIQIRFLKNCRNFIDFMLEYYPYLENHVHAENKKSVEWLKFLGAKIGEAKPYGPDGELFHHFYFERGDN